MPNSPVNLIGVTKFGKQIEPKEEEFPKGTNIQTFINHSVFTWDRGRCTRTIINPLSYIPMMHMNDGFKHIEALCSTLKKVDTEALYRAFITEHKLMDPEVLTFMKELKHIVMGDELTEDMACYHYYHNLLNHISLADMHMLAKRGKLPSKILNMKVAPPCASCLFVRAHRKA